MDKVQEIKEVGISHLFNIKERNTNLQEKQALKGMGTQRDENRLTRKRGKAYTRADRTWV